MDSFKKLKVKSQYEKVEVFTETIKVPLQRYLSFQLGGDKNEGEWMSLVDHSGSLCYLLQFEDSKLEELAVGAGEVKQVFSVKQGRFLLVCAESFMRIRESTWDNPKS